MIQPAAMNEHDPFDESASEEHPEVVDATLDRVRDWLRANEWTFDDVPDASCIRTGVQGKHARYRLVLGVRGEGPCFLVFGLYDFVVPSTRLASCADLVNRINFVSLVGCFEMDPDDGELRYRVTIPMEDAELSDGQIERSILVSASMADRWYPAFLALIHGGLSPSDAFESADRVH
jgi:hypothetical protein